MPGGDGTGPAGMGPMTGRAAGYCAGYPVPGYMNPIPGRGWGFGRGWSRGRGWFGGGRGWRHWYFATGLPGWVRAGYDLPVWGGYGAYPYYGISYGYPYAPEITPKEEAEMLKEQAKIMQEELKVVQEQISTLEKASAKEKK